MNIKSNPYLTVLTIVFGILVINIFLDLNSLLYISIVLAGVSIFSRSFTNLAERIWFKIAYLLSKIIPNILLSVVFYFLLTPLSILSKIFNSKTNFKTVNNSKTVFKNLNKNFNKESFEKTW